MAHQRLDVADRDRIDAGERLVEQHVARPRRQRAGDLDAAALAARQRDGRRLAQARDVEFLEQRVEIGVAPAAVRLHHFEHRADIVLDIEAAEDRGLLRQIADAEPRALVHRQRGDVVAVELDAAAVGLDQAGDHVEHRGLAGAVRPEQADRLAAPHIERDALDHHAAAEALLHAMGGEIGVADGLPAVAVAARARPPAGCALALAWRAIAPAHVGSGRPGAAALPAGGWTRGGRRRPASKQRKDVHRATSRRIVWHDPIRHRYVAACGSCSRTADRPPGRAALS